MPLQTFLKCDLPGCGVRFEIEEKNTHLSVKMVEFCDSMGVKKFFCSPEHLWKFGKTYKSPYAALAPGEKP